MLLPCDVEETLCNGKGHASVRMGPEMLMNAPPSLHHSGSEITLHYDPMLSKLITHGRDREHARQLMVHTRISTYLGREYGRDREDL